MGEPATERWTTRTGPGWLLWRRPMKLQGPLEEGSQAMLRRRYGQYTVGRKRICIAAACGGEGDKMTGVAGRHGVITEEGIRALRSRVGIPLAPEGSPFFEEATEDNIRNFAHSTGDVNPLFTDAAYSRETRWGAPVAPGCMLFSMGIPEGRPITALEREEGRGGGLPGVHAVWAGVDFEWFVPVLLGDVIYCVSYLSDVQEKQGRFAGRELLTTRQNVFRNQRSEVVAKSATIEMRVERDAARETAKYQHQPHIYTDEELAAIDEAYEREGARGAESCYWEDVAVGDEIPPIVRGPFVSTDAISFKMGYGFGPLVRTGKVAHEYRTRHPEAYVRNALNIPDVVERGHWEPDFARETGLPGCYDYGPQRVSWLGTLLTNWMGDDGWLKGLSVRVRRFNITGDLPWLRGRVAGKSVSGGEHMVACDVWAENRRGEVTASGRATVLLPSKGSGPIKFPAMGQPSYPSWEGPEGKVI